MIKNVQQAATCFPEESIVDVAKKLSQEERRQVYVVNQNVQLLGIVTREALITCLKQTAERDPKIIPAKEIMDEITSVAMDDEPETVMELMMKYHTTECPVVKEGILIGCISYRDVLYQIIEKKDGEMSKN